VSLEVKDSAIHGKGVFTTEFISNNSVIGRVNIARLVTDEHPINPDNRELEHHCHWYADGTTVLVGEPHRYLNHSCDPNTYYYTVNTKNKVSFLISIRDIQKDEELTLEYSLCVFSGKFWECDCGSPNCRGYHRCGFKYMERSRQILYLLYLDPIIVQFHSDSIQEILNSNTYS